MDNIQNQEKEIKAINIITQEEKRFKISMNKTVKQLKEEIVKLFNLNYNLDNQELRMRNPVHHAPKIITRENENKTLFQNNFKNECEVYFGQQQNDGGSQILY